MITALQLKYLLCPWVMIFHICQLTKYICQRCSQKMKFLNPDVKFDISPDNGHATSSSFSCESYTSLVSVNIMCYTKPL